MKAIVYTRCDGLISVMYPAPGARLVSGVRRADSAIQFSSAVTLDKLDRLLAAGFEPEFAESEDEFAHRLAEKIRDLGAKAVLLDPAALPDDRTFRNAWRLKDGAVQIDMEGARAVHLATLRRARNDLLRATDSIAQRALEQADQTAIAVIAVLRQRLRDMPSEIALSIRDAKCPAQLKALWPSSIADARRLVHPESKPARTV